jgi:hypothetical protein
VVAEAKRLRRASPKTGERLSYRKISAQLAETGHMNERGHPFNPKSMKTTIPTTRSRADAFNETPVPSGTPVDWGFIDSASCDVRS